MAFTAEEIRQEAQTFLDGAGQSLSAYLHMLDGIAKYHKYPLEQQAVLSYAPSGYTAVADRRIWEEFFRVQIMGNVLGVVLPDEKSPYGIKTVFDVSETDGWPDGKQPDLLWHFDAERDSAVFRGLADENVSAMDGLLQTFWNIEDAYAGSEKTGEERLLLGASVGYVLMKRLGFSREAEIHAEQTITEDLLFSVNTVPLQEISDISRVILTGIQDYVKKGQGRGEDFPLKAALERVGIYAKATEEAEARQEISSVEAPATEAASATVGAAAPEETGASSEPPAQMAATDNPSSVAAIQEEYTTSYYISPNTMRFVDSSNRYAVHVSIALRDDDSADISISAPDHSSPEWQAPITGQNRNNAFPQWNISFLAQNMEDALARSRDVFTEHLPNADGGLLAASVMGAYRNLLRQKKYDLDHQEAVEDTLRPIDDAKIQLADILSEEFLTAQQETSSVEVPATEAADVRIETSEPKGAVASPDAPADATATDGSATIAEDNQSSVSEFSRDVIDSRVYFISPDGKRSSKSKSSMYRIEIDLRRDGAAYIDIATHNRYSGTGILADDPKEAYNFALSTHLVQDFNSKVIADAIISDYQEMMQQHNIPVPAVIDQRRFDLSPDGVSNVEYTYDPENDRWNSSEPSPDNHVRVIMRYMSNGRIDVGISDSVTGNSRNFTTYDNLFNTARSIFGDVVPDGNADMLANWVLQHGILMKRVAKKDNQQEISSVEAPATEAADATKEAAEPKEADASPEPPAQMAATDDSSPVAAMEQYNNQSNKKSADEGGEKTLDLNNKEAVKEFAENLTYDDIPMEEIPQDTLAAAENGSNEEKLQRAIAFISSMRGKEINDPMGNNLYYAPGNTESIESYALHLI
ncbi:MAG: hypothetical protein IKW79_02805, partial [Schwartzia sp.]|nr:hypothetical protein [Schwartzia sp. (in: firmicutes)]